MPELPPNSPKNKQTEQNDNQPQVNDSPMHKMMSSCYKTTELVSLSYERPLTTVEKLQMYSHMAMCSGCRAFAKNSKTLNEMMYAHKEFEAKQTKDKAS